MSLYELLSVRTLRCRAQMSYKISNVLDRPQSQEVSIIPIGQNSTPGLTPEATASGKKKKKRNKKKAGQQQTGDSSEASPAVTVIPLNKDPGTIPAHLNPAVVLARRK